MWQFYFVRILKEHFEAAKTRNPRYSLRSYAKKVGLPVGALSEILQSKRKLSPPRALTILRQLNMSEREIASLCVLMGLPGPKAQEQLPNEQYDILGNWRHWATYCLVEIDGGVTAADIAHRLNILPTEADLIIQDLTKRGLIRLEGEKLVRTSQGLATSDGPPDERIRAHHRSSLELTAKAVETIPSPIRDSTTLTFTLTPSQIDLVKTEIRQLLEKVTAISGISGHEEVYHVNINLFPLNIGLKQ